MLMSMLFSARPDEVKLLLIDPKLLAEAGVRNVEAYNRRVAKAQGVMPLSAPTDAPEQPELPIQFLSEEARLSAGESIVPDDGPAVPAEPDKTPPEPLPYIVVM